MFLRDCAFLMRLYRRSDSRGIWSYAVFGFVATLGAFFYFLFFATATVFPAAFPAYVHPATASKEILGLEAVVIFLVVGFSVEYRFRRLRDDVLSVAQRYWSFGDRVK